MRYDLHIHSYYSRCSNLKPESILARAKKKRLNGIAITDHNTIKGALEVKKLNKDRNFEVIIGEEIKTDKGEVIGLYLKKEIKPGKFEDIIHKIKAQKGIVIIPHPFSYLGILRSSFKLELRNIKNKIDAVETFNARNFTSLENKKAKITAEKLNISQTGGSDSHFIFEIGKAYTICGADLKTAIKKRNTISKGSILLAIPARFLSLIIVIYNKINTLLQKEKHAKQ